MFSRAMGRTCAPVRANGAPPRTTARTNVPPGTQASQGKIAQKKKATADFADYTDTNIQEYRI